MGRKILMGCGALSILGVLGLAAVGCMAILGNSGPSTANQGQGSPTAPEEPGEPEQGAQESAEQAPAPEPEPQPITLSGTGPQASEAFELESGLAVVRLSHQGASNFIVHLLDGDSGEQLGASLVNRIGTFDGSTAFATGNPTAPYVLDVDADGPWSVTVEQPRPSDAPATRQFSGTGQTATDLFSLPAGLARISMSHQGESNFIVYLLDREGYEMGPSIVNEVGPIDASQAVQIPEDGIYLLRVDADGPWTITVE